MIILSPDAIVPDGLARWAGALQTRMALSVVIATRNRPQYVLTAIESILNGEAGSETSVIVVDQSDTDCTLRLLEERFGGCDHIQYVPMAGRGAASARNLGISLSHSDVIAITDDDCVVLPGWSIAVRDLFAAHREVDVIFGAVDAVAHDPLRSVVPVFTPLVRRIETCLADAHGFRGMSANMAIRRTVFEALGGFDERFGVGSLAQSAEDFELHFRALRVGFHVLIEPSLRVVHCNARPMVQAWPLWRRDAYGLGALAAHMLMLRRPRAAWRLWCDMVGRPALDAVARLRRAKFPTGLRCVATLALGFALGHVRWLWHSSRRGRSRRAE